MRIALICPSRGRPERFKAMVESAMSLANDAGRMTAYLMTDLDDPERDNYLTSRWVVRYMNGTKGTSVPKMMNTLAQLTTDDILFAVSDDILFRTQGWDDMLCAAFERYPDRLLLAYTNDGLDRDKCTHFAVHRRWVELAGLYVWPEFEHFYADEWCYRIGSAIGRTIYLRGLVTEHMHFKYGKSKKDETYSTKRGNGISHRDAKRMEELMPMVNEIADRMRAAMVPT